MAWKFRKRIKIAPGVNINISRGGISTTIGPKGASVNIGKKGAYLNTGVPGTGLYDRQKISNNPMNNQTNKGDGGYSGCILFIVILGVLLFCCFGLLKAISVISFIACLIVAALLSLIITLSNSEKSSGANTNTSDSSPVANPSTETEIQTPQTNAPTRQFAGLKEESFILLQTESSALYLFLKSASRSIKVRKELDRMMDLTNSDGTPWPLNNKISLSMLIDAYRCYTDLGYHMDHGEDEELGLLLFAAKVANPDAYLSYYNLEKFRITAAHSVRGTFDVAINVNRQISIPSGQYIFQHVLENVDKERMSEYMVALYRFASAIAKADGTIDARESVILANLMKAKDITTDGQLIHEVKESSQSKKKAKDDLITTEENVQDKENDSQSELHDLIGLSSVKEEVEKLSNYIKIMNVRKGKGLPTSEISYHCVFTGNPGTGKTTVARIIAGIYKDLGVIKKGHLIETDRSGLVAEYVGQTAVKTNAIIDSALDGVLFIDEAYSLVTGNSNDYGAEAISTLLKRMEDDRGRLIVILAGYGNEMEAFINSNPGLQSRFNRYIYFPDYNAEELLEIYKRNISKHKYVLAADAEKQIESILQNAVVNKDKNFGNARFVRNLFEKTIENQATRLACIGKLTDDDLCTITLDDLSTI